MPKRRRGEFLGAHVGDEGFNAVVAACGAFSPQLDHAQGEIHFIMNDEHAAGIQFEKPHHGAHAQTGFIHERGGFHQQDAGAGGHLALALPVRLEYGPTRAARRSSTMNPALWRVSS